MPGWAPEYLFGQLRVAVDGTPYAATGTTDANGDVTFTLPAGRFAAAPVCQVTPERATTTATQYCTAFIRSRTATQVVARVVESKSTGFGGTAEGLEAAGAGITVHLLARSASTA